MRVGLDGYPLAEPRTGVGHYTLELARALALIAPSDQFELVSPAPFSSSALEQINHANLSNLRAVHLKTSRIRGHWWAVGLPLYVTKARFDLFHGTNFEVPFWNRRSVVTIHDLSALLHREKHRLAGTSSASASADRGETREKDHHADRERQARSLRTFTRQSKQSDRNP